MTRKMGKELRELYELAYKVSSFLQMEIISNKKTGDTFLRAELPLGNSNHVWRSDATMNSYFLTALVDLKGYVEQLEENHALDELEFK